MRGCEQKIQGLKKSLASEVDAILAGSGAINDGPPKKPAAGAGKRKATDGNKVDGTPSKRGKKKKSSTDDEMCLADETTIKIKSEYRDEDEPEFGQF